ncbi:hypothetical protein GCM10027425_30520 [Alteromonas gracilis]
MKLVGVLVLVVGLALSAFVFWATGSSRVIPFEKPARLDGTTLEVTYGGTSCRSGASLEIEESEDRVVVTVEESTRAWSCDDDGVSYDVTGELEEPLGDRELVDGACALADYRGDPLCQEPTLAP